MTILSKISRQLSIRDKLLIAFVGLSALPLTIVGVYGIASNVEVMEQVAFENLNHDVQAIREKTANFLVNVEQDLNVLQNSSLVRRFAKELELNPTEAKNSETLNSLTAELLALARTKKIYYQIRMLDRRGDELFRIESALHGAIGRTYHIVPATEAQHIRESYYFFLVDPLESGQIACVPAELRHRERDHIAVFSFATPIVQKKGLVGILIANVFAEELFKVLEPGGHFTEGATIVLVNAEGHYVYHSEKKSAWDLLLASRDEDNLLHDYPPTIADKLVSGGEGVLTVGNQIISYAPLFRFQRPMIRQEASMGLAGSLFVFESVSKDLVMKPVYKLAWTYTGFLAFFLVTAAGLGLLATRQFTKPIAKLQEGAEIISEGNYRYPIVIQTGDEIEKLAERFNAMAASLERHEEEIREHRAKLEEMVRQRTRELEEEKNKLQVILNSVPSALILLDKNLSVQSVSAAYGSLTRDRIQKVQGMVCNLCADFGVSLEQCPSRKALSSGRVESLLVKRKDPDLCYEHVAIPIKRDGEVGAVLEIITDITERSKLQDQLVRAERATAVGEMAAVIAHEVRNSLTSIKLILQYIDESEKLRGRKEKESIKVAMNSMHRLESVVNELLNFSKPREMHFGRQDINQIVKESILFSRHQFERKQVTLVEDLSPRLPELIVDGGSLKEVVFNLLLNAVDAVAESGGVVRMKTGLLELPETIHESIGDYRFFREGLWLDNSAQRDPSSIRRIELRKGETVVMIEVSDNGSGIANAYIERIFDPFFTTKTEGTGLGLTMAKRVVNEHGGVILVNSEEGKGSSFRILLSVRFESR